MSKQKPEKYRIGLSVKLIVKANRLGTTTECGSDVVVSDEL